MLTPGRRSRRSILTPSRSNTSTSRISSPAPTVEKSQVVLETTQYKLETVPNSVHSLARDVLKRRRASLAGLAQGLGYVAEGNKVLVWNVGGNKMFELCVPSTVSSVHITETGGAVVVTDKSEIVRWSRVDQTHRYTVHHGQITCGVVDTTLHHDKSTLLLLDSSLNVWMADERGVTQLNPASRLGGISRRVSSLIWNAPETLLGEALNIVSCNDVIFVVGTKGIQRIHGTAITWTSEIRPLISNSCELATIIHAVAGEGVLKCLCEVDAQLYAVSLSSLHTTIPCSVDSSIQLQIDDVSEVRLYVAAPSTDLGLLYSERECHVIKLGSGVCMPVEIEGVLSATPGDTGDINLITRQHGLARLVVKDVKAAVSNMNLSASEGSDSFQKTEKKFLGAFKCFMDFNETQQQASLQDILGTEDTDTINKIISDLVDHLISAAPASDPRWGGSDSNLPVTLGLQVEERIRRLKGLLQFVVATGYYENLTSGTDNLAVRILQLVEKCLIAKTLCGSECVLLKQAVDETAPLFKGNSNELSSEDVLFSNISRIEVIYSSLATGQNTVLSSKAESETLVQDLFASVEFVQQTFDSILSWRAQSRQLYQLAVKSDTETWCDTDEMRTLLTAQAHIALETVLAEVDEEGRYQVLLVSASLVESVLKLYQDILGRLPPNDNRTANLQSEFERRREMLIGPFAELKIYQIAFTLAEQFQHFSLLVQMCEETNDMVKLRTLSASHPPFAEVAYKWYLEQGKPSRLLAGNVADPAQLSKFLNSKPQLKWIHQLGNKDYYTAGDSLNKLGCEENDSLSRKKTLLSLSKLSYLADGMDSNSENINSLNRNLDIITYQERLKPEVVERAGLTPDHMTPISGPDLIRLSVGEYNPTLEDVDVKKTLDLLQSLAAEEDLPNSIFEKLRLDIWRAVIERDEWWGSSLSSPDNIHKTLFYRAVILAFNSGLLVAHFLPSVDELVSLDAWKLHFPEEAQFKQFEYVLRSGYEQMNNLGLVSQMQ